MLAIGALLPMVVWLLWECNSMTSISGLTMTSAVMLLSTRPTFRRKPALLHLMVLAVPAFSAYALFFNSGSLLQGVGRDPTLTGRTDVWHFVLSVPNSPLVGAGYETFWVGSRLQTMWTLIPGLKVQEAHNGYIEIFLNMGWVGVILLATLIATGYASVIATCRRNPEIGSLRLALILSAVNTGFTEAAFRMMGPPWLAFLLATIAVPVKTMDTARKGDSRGRSRRRLSWPAQEPDAAVTEGTALSVVHAGAVA
jgi:O-antigen ligase